jgi:hypothetical protein
MEDTRIGYRMLVMKPKGNKPLTSPRSKCDDNIKPSDMKINLNYSYISRFNSYRAVNTLHLGYTCQSAKAVREIIVVLVFVKKYIKIQN